MTNEMDKSVLQKCHKNKMARYVEKEDNECAAKVINQFYVLLNYLVQYQFCRRLCETNSSFQNQAQYSESSDRDWELRERQEIVVLDDEQLNEYEETCLHPQPFIEPICR